MAEREGVANELESGDTSLALLTVEEAARRLCIGRTTCFRLVLAGELESVTVGRLRRVPADAVPAFVARLRHQPAEATWGRTA
ncbi:excisionase family DNA-binding protein [Streptomyces sp. NPDC020917]|uniref:excisionase family DNA-binding protein n=1 Tax=Streptomyces sp. NPDC020917 TaxID=3365102 RepID=UPI0037A785C9